MTQAVSGAEFDEGGDYEHGSKDGDVVYKETKVKRNKDKDRVILQIDPNELVKQTTSTTDCLIGRQQ